VLGDAAQLNYVFNQQVETAIAKISEMCWRRSSATMTTVIVSEDGKACRYQSVNQAKIPPDMLTHPMRNLHNAAHGLATIPARASNR
jgi:hypothetical protein